GRGRRASPRASVHARPDDESPYRPSHSPHREPPYSMPGTVESFGPKCYKPSHVTGSHTMKRTSAPLGDLEHELLTILWKHGEMTATAVRKHVARKLKDPTIRTVLRRLEEKGYVTHSVVSGTFIYRARESAETTAATAVQGIVE